VEPKTLLSKENPRFGADFFDFPFICSMPSILLIFFLFLILFSPCRFAFLCAINKQGLMIMYINILNNKKEIGERVAEIILNAVKENPRTILGLATGSSPLDAYEEIILQSKHHGVSFREVKTFNLDEYLHCSDPHQTYRAFMEENLFKGIDLPRSNSHFPNPSHPEEYDQEIAEAGGIDIQLLGIGRDGHIGFNEPGTAEDSKTHIIELTESTIEANARFFHNDKSKVPTQAVSMGLGTIMKARHIILIANDPTKKEAIENLLKKNFNPDWPATILSKHPNVDIFLTKDVFGDDPIPQGVTL